MSAIDGNGFTQAQERDSLHISLSEASFEEFERAFLAFQRKWLKRAESESDRLETKRRAAEDILLGAYGRPCSWEDFNRALQRIRRLGYTNAGKRVEVAALFALSTSSFPEQASSARAMLDEAERRLSCVRKDNGMRKEWMKEIRRIRRMTGWQALAAPSRSGIRKR